MSKGFASHVILNEDWVDLHGQAFGDLWGRVVL